MSRRCSRAATACASRPPRIPRCTRRSARVSLDGKVVGWIGELHPRWAQQADLAHAPVVFELDVAALSEGELPQVREQSRQPIVVRDLALWVDAQVPVQSMLDTVTALAKTDSRLAVLRDLRLFDVAREVPGWRARVREKPCFPILATGH